MKLLRCKPTFFDVVYAINPHMKIGSVDKALAYKQWEEIGEIYKSIGVDCIDLDGIEGLPDIVFTANQSLPFVKADGSKAVVLSNMRAEERRAEVDHLRLWYESQNYEIHRIDPSVGFLEGMGDTIYHEDKSFLWAGYGFRTTEAVHQALAEITGLELRPLKLVDPDFYHLDVCLCVLGAGTALVYKPAFDEESFAKIEDAFDHLIELSKEEAYNFAGNAHCPDGKHVILQKGSDSLELKLTEHGFTPISVDTSEYMKSGGSVFCMKMELP